MLHVAGIKKGVRLAWSTPQISHIEICAILLICGCIPIFPRTASSIANICFLLTTATADCILMEENASYSRLALD
jgi:hypothetical protein